MNIYPLRGDRGGFDGCIARLRLLTAGPAAGILCAMLAAAGCNVTVKVACIESNWRSVDLEQCSSNRVSSAVEGGGTPTATFPLKRTPAP